MLRRSELPPVSELPALDDDTALFDPSPEWFIPGLRLSFGEPDEPDDAELGFRSLIEQPDALRKAWHATGLERSHRARRAERRHAGRRPRSPVAA